MLAKIFHGKPEKVEEQLNDWIQNNLIVLQYTNVTGHGDKIIVVVFYKWG